MAPENMPVSKARDGLVDSRGQIDRIATWLVTSNLFTITLAMLFYADQFDFWEDALSWLGRTRTPDGEPNLTGAAVFVSGMFVTSLILFRIAVLIGNEKHLHRRRTKVFLFRLAGIGCVVMTAPSNLFSVVHQIGAAMVFAPIWMLGNLFLSELRETGESTRFYFAHLLLQGTVLPYAFLYVVGSPNQYVLQKFGYAGLLISTKLIIHLAARQSVPVDIKDRIPTKKPLPH